MGHAYIAAGDGPCRVLSVCSGTEAQLIAAAERISPADAAAPQPRRVGA
jgi:hypothetical protein